MKVQSFFLLLSFGAAALPPQTMAGSVGSVDVMEIDEVHDAATIARAKARKHSEDAEKGGGEDSESFGSGGCSDLNIGNIKTGVGQPVPRNVTIVIEGPVVQENKCR